MTALLVIVVAACSSNEALTPVDEEPTYLSDFNLRADPGNGQVTLNWLMEESAETYNIYVGTSKSSLTKIATVPASIISAPYTVTGLSNNTTYWFSVTGVNPYGESNLATPITAMPSSPSPPPAPENVRANAGNAQVTVTWTPVAGATSYNVYCFWQTSATDLGLGSLAVAGSTTDNKVVTDVYWSYGIEAGQTKPLVNGRIYTFWVTAINDLGTADTIDDLESYPSFDVVATPSTTPPPFAPANLDASNTAANLDPGQIYLDWSDVAGATSYNVYLGIAKNVTKDSYSAVAIGTLPIAGYIWVGLDEGRTYYFVVTAVNANGESAESAEVHEIPKASP